jgi:hypothetical protein
LCCRVAEGQQPALPFQRGDKVVRIRTDENGRSLIERVSAAFLARCLSDVANFYHVTYSGKRKPLRGPPLAVARVLLACPDMWDLPRDPDGIPGL